jgi:ribosomal-protein-alanine N-acetyltransferase
MASMPTEFLTTERLILRPFAAQDAAAFYRLNGDPEVMRWLPKDEVFATEAEALQFVQHYLAASANWPFARWAVTEKKTGDFLGWSGLRELPDGEVDLGYRLLREHWGLGYATESGRAWVRYGFEQAGLPSIIARTARGNLRSQRTLEKLGFQLEGTFRDEEEGWEGLLYRCERSI